MAQRNPLVPHPHADRGTSCHTEKALKAEFLGWSSLSQVGVSAVQSRPLHSSHNKWESGIPLGYLTGVDSSLCTWASRLGFADESTLCGGLSQLPDFHLFVLHLPIPIPVWEGKNFPQFSHQVMLHSHLWWNHRPIDQLRNDWCWRSVILLVRLITRLLIMKQATKNVSSPPRECLGLIMDVHTHQNPRRPLQIRLLILFCPIVMGESSARSEYSYVWVLHRVVKQVPLTRPHHVVNISPSWVQCWGIIIWFIQCWLSRANCTLSLWMVL